MGRKEYKVGLLLLFLDANLKIKKKLGLATGIILKEHDLLMVLTEIM